MSTLRRSLLKSTQENEEVNRPNMLSKKQEDIFDDKASLRTDIEHETSTSKNSDNGHRQHSFSKPSNHLKGGRPRVQWNGGSEHAIDADNDNCQNNSERGGQNVPSTTSAALNRFKGMNLRSGSTGRAVTPRLVSMVTGATTSHKEGSSSNNDGHIMTGRRSPQTSAPERNSGSGDEMVPPPLLLEVPVCAEAEESLTESTAPQEKLMAAIFDDSNEENSNVEDGDSERGENQGALDQEDQEYAASPRSNWAATLMASTMARAKSTGKLTAIGSSAHMLPHPQDFKAKVDYLIVVCKAAETYASSQTAKLIKVRDGQHMISQLQDVAMDLGRQRDKILAVYDTREVQRSTDRLGQTLKEVYELIGDIEGTGVMFGKKKAFGKRVNALVHDIGTNANALLAATSLAIADRSTVLYKNDMDAGEPPAPQQEELAKKCIEGDKFFFGRGDKLSHSKAYEAYSWAAERGFAEAMYMIAWMYRAGTHVEADAEQCQLWLERAVDEGYAPAINDLAVILLAEADQLEEAYPEIKTDAIDLALLGSGGSGGSNDEEGCTGVDENGRGDTNRLFDEHKERMSWSEKTKEEKSGVHANLDEDIEMESIPPEQANILDQVVGRRKRAMQLLQEAAKMGHTEAMTNLGNMNEAMGYLEEARTWYSLAADPSESANNARAQNYLGTLFYEGRGVAKDLQEAVKWFRRSARQGNAQACQNLGICHQAGLGVPKDMPKAAQLFRQAVEGGSIPATNNLAYMLARDALHTLATAARQAPSGVRACGKGLKFEDPSKGLMQMGKASTKSSSEAWRKTTAQLREAADLFRRAADNGVMDASYQLGRLYQQGLGIPVDPVAAFENFLVAAEGRVVHPTAATCVGDMLYTGIGCLQNYAEAMRFYFRAANAGEPAAANSVGLMHELGRGVARDLSVAAAWYARAAELGSADGAFNAALLLERGDPLSAFVNAAGPFSLLTRGSPPPPHSFPSETGRSKHKNDCNQVLSPSSSATKGDDDNDVVCEGKRAPVVAENRKEAQNNRQSSSTSQQQQRTKSGEVPTSDYNNTTGRRINGDRKDERREGRETLGHKMRGSHGEIPLSSSLLFSVDREAALHMFELAESLGHPGAKGEINRLRLRLGMNNLVGGVSFATVAGR